MLKRKELHGKVCDTLANLTCSIRLRSAGGDLGTNYAAEDFYCGLLNIVMQKEYPGLRLENLNSRKNNFPAVDLGDEKQGIAVQITTTEKRGKINHTLSEFFTHGQDAVFSKRLIILVIGKKDELKSDFKILKEKDYGFDYKQDVWDTDQLGKEIAKLDLETMEKLYEYLCEQVTLIPQTENVLYLPVSARDENLFVGREEELAELARRVEENGNTPIFITGLGGMGKTELVARFCRTYTAGRVYFVRFQKRFTDTVALGMAAGIEGYDQRKPDPEQDYKDVLAILAKADARDLLVIDNADEANGNFGVLQTDPGWQDLRNLPLRLVITTRCEVPRSIRVEHMANEKLYQFFENQELTLEKTEMDALIAAVKGHTMTVELMARTLKRSRTLTTDKLLNALEKGDLRSQRMRPVEIQRNGQVEQQEVYTHLRNLFNVAEISEDARDTLRDMVLLPENGLSMDILEAFRDDEYLEFVESLIDHGWLGYDEDTGCVAIHPVVRMVCREELKPDDENCGNFLNVIWHLYDRNQYDAARFRQFAELFSRASDILPDKKAIWAINAGVLWNEVGLAENALKSELRAVACLEAALPGTEELFKAYNNLATSYLYVGDPHRAVEFQLKALAIDEKIHGPEDPVLADGYGNLGSFYWKLGDYQKSLEYHLKALKIHETGLPSNHPHLAISYNNVGSTYGALNQHKKALEYRLKALDIFEKILPADHPDLANVYNNLGVSYSQLNDHKRSLEYKLKALEILEKVFVPDHPDLATAYDNAGVTFQSLGKYEKALEYGIKALNIREKVLFSDHPDLAVSYYNLGYIYAKMGNLETGLKYLKKSLNIRETFMPKGHERIESVRKTIATVQMQLNLQKAGIDVFKPFGR